MPNQVMITPLTLYNLDNTVFDGITLPDYHFPRSIEYEDLFLTEGWTLDKDTLINNLLLETMELNTIYTSPDFFKFAVTQWAKKEFPVWRSLYETLFYKYNPIWNKDGTIKENAENVRNMMNNGNKVINNVNISNNSERENIVDNDETNRERTRNESNIDNKTGKSTNSENNTNINNESNSNVISDDTTITNSVSAYDQTSTFSDRDKTVTENDKTETKNNNSSNIGTTTSENNNSENNVNVNNEGEEEVNIREYSRERNNSNNSVNNNNSTESNNGNENENNSNSLERRETGNIGLVTTQAMIQAERDLVKFNIYDFIIDSFKMRFCILIY